MFVEKEEDDELRPGDQLAIVGTMPSSANFLYYFNEIVSSHKTQ
jgi:hypothetical protein